MDSELNGDHSAIRRLRQRWEEEGAEHDRIEQWVKKAFVEEHAREIFAQSRITSRGWMRCLVLLTHRQKSMPHGSTLAIKSSAAPRK